MKRVSTAALVWSFTVALLVASAAVKPPASQKSAQLRAIETYISRSWHTLTRSHKDLAQAATDPKFPLGSERRLPIYIAGKEDVEGSSRHFEHKCQRQTLPASSCATCLQT